MTSQLQSIALSKSLRSSTESDSHGDDSQDGDQKTTAKKKKGKSSPTDKTFPPDVGEDQRK
jgi:hypothetical protein